MDFQKLYKETFSQVHTSVTLDLEDQKFMKKSGTMRKVLLIAAVVALVAAIGITAYATNFFGAGLRDFIVQPPASGQEDPYGPYITLQGYAESPESKAFLEWKAFLDSHEVVTENGEDMAFWSQSPYNAYDVYDQESEDKLIEIAAKYGITLHRGVEIAPYEKLVEEAVGGSIFNDDHRSQIGAVLYDSGTFHYDGEWTPSDGPEVGYQLFRSVRGTMVEAMLYIRDPESYTEWQYECQGYTFTLALNGFRAIVLADLGSSFVSINVLEGRDVSYLGAPGRMTEERLEAMVESFRWDALATVKQPDLAAITAYNEELYNQENITKDPEVAALPIVPWQEEGRFEGCTFVDGEVVPLKGIVRVANMARGDLNIIRLMYDGAEMLIDPPFPGEGHEYFVFTIELTLLEGPEEINLEACYAAYPEFRFYFDIEGDTEEVDITIFVTDPLYGQTLRVGETVTGQIAFIGNSLKGHVLDFFGLGATVRLDIG